MNKQELFQAIVNVIIIILLTIIISDLIFIRDEIDELGKWLYLINKMLLV